MGQPTGTYSQYDSNSLNEDLEQVIYDISPYDTPFLSALTRRKVTNIRHEWQIDALAPASGSNAVIEGDDATLETSSPTTRVSNIAQILDKTVVVSGTHQAVDSAGYADVLAYQLTKKGRELKTDIEKQLLANQASVLGDDTTARRFGSLMSWMTTNTDRASDGADGGYSTTTSLTVAATDTTGSGRTFTETLLVNVQQSCYTAGAEPTKLLLAPFQKRQFTNATNFPGIADLRSPVPQGKAAKIVGNAEVYLGPFGTLDVVVDRFQRVEDAWLIDPEYAALGVLRPMKQWPLAKNGDAEKRQMLTEVTLIVENEAAHGVVADLTTS